MPTKSLFASKTFWANVIGLALAIAKYYGVEPIEFDDSTLALLLGAVNIALRTITEKPVHV